MVEILSALIIACSNMSFGDTAKTACIVRVTDCYNQYLKDNSFTGVSSGFGKSCAKEVK